MTTRWTRLAAACACLACLGADAIRFEAEDCVANRDAFVKDAFPADKWTLWTRDKDARKKWSGGAVLKSPSVKADRAAPQDGAPPLHIVLKGIPKGTYDVRVRTVRAMAVSADGKTWRRLQGDMIAGNVTIEHGTYAFWVDDRYAMANPKHRGSSYIDWIEVDRSTSLVNGVWNGDFELAGRSGPKAWPLPKGSEAVRATVVHDAVHSGRNAVRFQAGGKANVRWGLACNRGLPAAPGRMMRVSAWVRGAVDGAAYLRVDGCRDGKHVRRFVGRAIVESAADWTQAVGCFRVPEDVNELRLSVYAFGPADLVLDDIALTPGAAPKHAGRKVNGWAAERVREKLDRGVVALRTGRGAYISWRLLETDPTDVAFDVLRIANGGRPTPVNTEPIRQTCDVQDEHAPEQGRVVYRVVPRAGAGPAGQAVLAPRVSGTPYIRIPLKDRDVRPGRVAVGDLDGDGAMDFVIRHPHRSIDPGTSYWRRSEDTYKLEAYTSAGKFLWRRDLGWSIEAGVWFSPFVVRDVNGDGRAEVIAKTGEGDPRDAEGKVLSGPEWVTVMDGRTGKDLCRAPWPARKGFANHNLAARNQLAVAYLDGKTPCIVALRGTYARMKVEAHQMIDGRLEELWSYDNALYPPEYWGQGAHTTRAVDVDGDGRDEVVLGSVCLDDDGAPLWTIGRGHPDGLHVGDVLPSRPGFEVFYCMETRQKVDGGLSLVDAATGQFIWKLAGPTRHVHSGGMCADLDPTVPGRECYGADTDERKRSNRAWLFSAHGRVLRQGVIYGPTHPTIFWDADLQREVFRGRISDHDGGVLEARPGRGMVADIVGDWREEAIASVPGELRIYSTTVPAMDRRVCLLQDPVYRACVCMASMGYITPPTLSAPPASSAPNVNLTFIEADDACLCRVVVSAPRQAGLTGELRLRTEGNVKLAGRGFRVDLKPAAIMTRTVRLERRPKEAIEGRVIAELTSAAAVLRGEVWVKTTGRPATRGALVEAEAFADQGGGKVHVRSDKANVRAKCISHWDRKGHFLEWRVDVPCAGRYELLVRYCAPHESKRRLTIDGAEVDILTFPVTGGYGDAAADWEEVTFVDKAGKRFRLGKGRHTIRLENTSDTGMNVDYLGFVRR